MIEDKENTQTSGSEQAEKNALKNWVADNWLRGLIAAGTVAILGISAYGLITNDANRANVVVIGILTLISLVILAINAASTSKIVDIMERQENEMIQQRVTMQDSLKETRQALNQTDKMFYASNRAYVGLQNLGIESGDDDGRLIHRLPEGGGQCRIGCVVINKGKTPAFNFGHVFRLIFTKLPVPNKPAVDFQTFDENRIVPQLLVDKPETIYGDVFTCVPELYKELVIDRTRLMILSVKFAYNCLNIRDEEYIAHYIWDVDEGEFMFRRNWPAGAMIIELTRNDANQARPAKSE